jgi:hypothetical protein
VCGGKGRGEGHSVCALCVTNRGATHVTCHAGATHVTCDQQEDGRGDQASCSTHRRPETKLSLSAVIYQKSRRRFRDLYKTGRDCV